MRLSIPKRYWRWNEKNPPLPKDATVAQTRRRLRALRAFALVDEQNTSSPEELLLIRENARMAGDFLRSTYRPFGRRKR